MDVTTTVKSNSIILAAVSVLTHSILGKSLYWKIRPIVTRKEKPIYLSSMFLYMLKVVNNITRYKKNVYSRY